MFDRAVCTPMRFAEAPVAALGALQALAGVAEQHPRAVPVRSLRRREPWVRAHSPSLGSGVGESAMRHDRAAIGREQWSNPICSPGPASRSPGWAPAWEALPAQARAELTALMIRLILDHARSHPATAVKGARHEVLKDSAASSRAQGDPVCAAVICPPGSPQPGERHPAICHAGPAGCAGLVDNRDRR